MVPKHKHMRSLYKSFFSLPSSNTEGNGGERPHYRKSKLFIDEKCNAHRHCVCFLVHDPLLFQRLEAEHCTRQASSGDDDDGEREREREREKEKKQVHVCVFECV